MRPPRPPTNRPFVKAVTPWSLFVHHTTDGRAALIANCNKPPELEPLHRSGQMYGQTGSQFRMWCKKEMACCRACKCGLELPKQCHPTLSRLRFMFNNRATCCTSSTILIGTEWMELPRGGDLDEEWRGSKFPWNENENSQIMKASEWCDTRPWPWGGTLFCP